MANSTRVAVFLPHVQWRAWIYFAIPAVIGIFFGRELFVRIDPDALKTAIAAFILIAVFLPKGKSNAHWPIWTLGIAGAIAGTAGMLIGAVNPTIAPFFLRANILKERLIASVSTCQMLIHLLKVIAFGTLSFAFNDYWQLILWLGGAVILGALLGKRLVGKLSERMFTLIFKGSLIVIAVKLLIWG